MHNLQHALITTLFIIIMFLTSSCAKAPWIDSDYQANILTGLDVIERDGFKILAGKHVGLITNATGVNSQLESNIDIFHNAENFELTALYGPEHGVRGDYPAGHHVPSYTDNITGLPVFSLYGSTRKPTEEMLENIDVLVFDIQDIGTRSYTYISTMGLTMEAAAEHDIEMIILDRPNPLGGNRIEGNLVQDGYKSFVSPYKIPYIHGLTVGELALMLNDQGMLTNGVACDLTVIPMKKWTRDMTFDQTGLHWIPTSPHIPHSHTPFYYAASGIIGELQTISEGVGYTLPFELLGAEWINSQEVASKMNDLELPGIMFSPVSWRPFYGRDKDKTLHGVQVHITQPDKAHLMSLQFRFMEVLAQLYPHKNPLTSAADERIRMFDRVVGSSKVRKMFLENMRYEDIEEYLNKDIENFRETSEKYHLYK
ncbi:MAG: exo-beta-N-acetylmuramidase NamZ domain-containing protein [Desulfonatronovibrio sp.]